MQNCLFALLYILPFVILIWHKDEGGISPLRLNCANLLVLFYLLSNHVGLLLLYLNADGFKQLITINKDTVIILAFYSLIVVLAYLLSGFFVGKRYCKVRIPDIKILSTEKINFYPIVIVGLIALPIATIKLLDNSPLLILLSGDALGASAARVESSSIPYYFFGLKESYINIIFKVLSFSLIILLVEWLAKKSWKPFLLFIVLFFINGLYQFSNTSKGFIVEPLCMLVCAYGLIFKNGYILNKMTYWSLGILVSIVSVFTSWVLGNEMVDFIYPLERLVIGNLIPQYVVINYFELDNLLLGKSLPSWFSFGLHDQFLIDFWAWKEITGWVEGGKFYSAPSSFVSEAHANFHIFGVVIISIIIFFALRVVDLLINKIKSEIIFTSMMTFTSLHLSYVSVSAASSKIIDYYLWAVLIFGLYIYKIRLK